MAEYSITAEEMKEIVDLIGKGWRCVSLEADETLYICIESRSETKEYEFVAC